MTFAVQDLLPVSRARISPRVARASLPVLMLLIWLPLLGGAAESGVGSPLFGMWARYDTGATPWSVATGDLNGDGRLDLVTANSTSNNVSVLLGNGDGTFGTKVDYATGSDPHCVALGDLNGDGRLDLATANGSSNSVSILLGEGDGTFALNTDYATGSLSWTVAISDLNGDGKPDLAVANRSSNTVSILLGNGDATFRPKVDYGVGRDPFFVAIADVSGDGKPDLVTANSTSNSVSVLLGVGDGSFGASADYQAGSSPRSVGIGDLNGDNKPDLAVANLHDPSSNTVSVLLGAGDGSFGPKADYQTGDGPSSVAVGDIDGDGRPDLAVTNLYSFSISVLLGRGDGTFGMKIDYGTNTSPYGIAMADLNGDGRPDLVASNVNGSTVSVLLNIANRAPTLNEPMDMTVNEGATADQVLNATDPDGQALTFSLVTGPTYATVTTTLPGTGTAMGNLHLAPGFSDAGTATAVVQVSDGSLTDSKSLAFTVNNPAQSATNLLVNGGFETSSAIATETDGLPYYFYAPSVTSLEGWTIGGSAMRTLVSRPPYWRASEGNRCVTVESGYGSSIEQGFSTTIGARYVIRFAYAPEPDAISTSPSDRSMNVLWDGVPIANVTDVDPTIEDLDWTYHEYMVTATGSTSVIRFEDGGVGIPSVGPYLDDVSVTLEDSPPVISPIPDQTVAEGATADQTLNATDPDGDPLTFTKVAGPTFATVTSTTGATGNLHLAPGISDTGSAAA